MLRVTEMSNIDILRIECVRHLQAIALATATLVGNALGADRPEDAAKGEQESRRTLYYDLAPVLSV